VHHSRSGCPCQESNPGLVRSLVIVLTELSRLFPEGKSTSVPIEQAAGWAPHPVWLPLPGIEPGRLARSVVTALTELPRFLSQGKTTPVSTE
jgi:hypothetical protein